MAIFRNFAALGHTNFIVSFTRHGRVGLVGMREGVLVLVPRIRKVKPKREKLLPALKRSESAMSMASVASSVSEGGSGSSSSSSSESESTKNNNLY